MAWYEWRPYVPVAARRAHAALEVARLRKKGRPIAPIVIEGRTIARTFWGKAWCDNLRTYSDFANRLPRGRTYVRNGSVMDLQLGPGTARALVSGSDLYRVSVRIAPLPATRWRAVVRQCAGQIGSLVELLQGRFSRAVMETLIQRETGLFPAAREITFECSCPDWAAMCKHVAATLYGIGARLDLEPELFFRLRRVDQLDLLTAAQSGATLAAPGRTRKRIAATALADVFGIELDQTARAGAAPPKHADDGREAPSAADGETRRRTAAHGEPAPTRVKRRPSAPTGTPAASPPGTTRIGRPRRRAARD